MEVAELLGHTRSLMEELDEYLNQVNTEEPKFIDFQQVVDIEKLDAEYKQTFTQAIEKIEFAKFIGRKLRII